MADVDSKRDVDLFDDLDREEREFNKDAEIDRILHAFKLNPYEVLDLLPGIPESDIKITYRKKSLLIHPDKTKNPQAPDAFDRLKKAQESLMDEKARERLDEAISDARTLIMREKKWTVDAPQLKEENFMRKLWPQKTKEVLMDQELRKMRQHKAQMQEEGRQRRKEEEEIEERKRKREEKEEWDGGQDDRVKQWRTFTEAEEKKKAAKTGKKSKKQKIQMLG